MPRKKKSSSAEGKELLGVAGHGVSYTGKVTIQKVRGKRVVSQSTIRNSGCLPLFNFFADCIMAYGDDNADGAAGLLNSKPQYLDGFYVAEPESPSGFTLGRANASLKSYVRQRSMTKASSQEEGVTDSGTAFAEVSIQFLILDSNIKDTVNVIGLYGANNVGEDDVLPHAYIVIKNPSDYITYEAGTNYIITWVLRISN